MADMTFPLLDWRRRVSGLYSDVRRDGAADPRGSLQRFRKAKDALFAGHRASPIPATFERHS